MSMFIYVAFFAIVISVNVTAIDNWIVKPVSLGIVCQTCKAHLRYAVMYNVQAAYA